MSVWDEARVGGAVGNRHALGLWHPLHKLASLGWMPPVSQRRQIHGKKRYVYVLNFPNLTVNQVANDRFSVTSDFWWTDTASETDFTAENTQFARFSVQLFDTKNQRRFMNFPEIAENFGGGFPQADAQVIAGATFTMPYIHRRITRIPAGSVLLMRIQNTLQTAGAPQSTVNIQVALGGYIDG